MDFWGVEVKNGEPCIVEAGQDRILHLSQACLGEVKKDKGNESIYLYVTIDGKKLVLGTLSSEKFPQLQFDLVFKDKFELSHSWKNGSVYFLGYRCDNQSDESEYESEEDLPANIAVLADNGKPESQATRENPPATQNATTAIPDSAASKKKVKIVEPKKDVKTVEEEDSSEDDFGTDSSENGSDSDEDEDSDTDSESGEGDTEDDDEEEETPKEVDELSKKRPAESASATQRPDKKAKFVTPQKTETKKSGDHVDTPYPSKQAGKTPANQLKQPTPKPAGSHPCKSCTRSFNSENALDSHTKAKHTSGK